MSSEDSNSIKRRRVARACDTCRRKKVRCDGVQPGSDPPSCTNCKAYGYECAFIDAPKKRGPPKGYIEALETRLQRMESILGGLVQSGDLPEGTISSNLEWINVNESNFRSTQESNSLRKSSYNSSSTLGSNSKNSKVKSLLAPSNHNSHKNNSDSDESFSNDGNEYSGSQYDLNDCMGQIAMDESGHTRYLGNSSGIFLLKITKKVANGQIISIPKCDWHSPVKRIGANIALELPPKELCDKLLDSYWNQVHPYMPFIDKQDLMEKYENLENNCSSIILLYSIFSVSARFIDDPAVRSDPNDITTAGADYFIKAKELLKDEFDKATISTVQSLLLLSAHSHAHKDSVTWVYIGLAIRLAQDMGLHRDSSKWNFDERQGEVRRRVWWACFMVDRFASACLGRPLAINESDCDVDYPVMGKIPDDDEEAIEVWIEMIKCNSILGRILNHIYGIKSKSSQGNVESVLASLDNELNEWRDKLPKKFHFDSTAAHASDISSNKRMYMHLTYYTQQILLHRPHIRGPKSKAPPSSIPSLTICTMAANNITHVLYRAIKDGSMKLSWNYSMYSFFTAASMHIINALSGDDRFREVAKHGLRITLKCLECLSEYWFSTEKLNHIIRDVLKMRNIELEGFAETTKPRPQKRKAPGNCSTYVKLEEMTSEGISQDKNPFIDCLSDLPESRPKIAFAPSPKHPASSSTNLNSFEQQQQPSTTFSNPAYATFWNSQQNIINNSTTTSIPTLNQSSPPSPQSTKSPASDAMQYEQTSSPESVQFAEYLTAESGLFPPNADAFNTASSISFDVDDPMSNNNPFLSLPSAIDWNDWTDWTEYMLRVQNIRNPNPNVGNIASSANIMTTNGMNTIVSNPNIQTATTLINSTNIPSMAGNNNSMTH